MDRRVVLAKPVCLIAAVLGLLCTFTWAAKPDPPATAPQRIDEGQRVFVCGHSFHVYIAPSLAKLAEEGGLKKHQTAGVQMLGSSEVHQHWNLPDGRNKAKAALTAGLVDVLTLSPAWGMPDKAIDKFVDLALSGNPGVRVILQQSWSAYDGAGADRIKDVRERDKKTVADLKPRLDAQRAIFEQQARQINQRCGKELVFVAPAGQAVLALRQKIIEGEAPGLQRQSDLFRDALGHGREPVQNLVSYVFFACIYQRSPIGMKAFTKAGDDAHNRLDRLLQNIAWETVRSHPCSGVKADAP
jgi:hypothetical protein